jgi:hypothetical protein
MSDPIRRPSLSWKQAGDSLSPGRLQTVDADCCHCGRRMYFPAPTIIDAAERHWRERYEALLGSLNEVVAKCHVKHGTDPMREDFQGWLIEIRKQLKIAEEGEEWKSP